MDQLRLAQFNDISNSLNSQGYDFLKNNKININRIIPNDFYQGIEQDAYTGYTYLHFAAKNVDLLSINELIKNNADILKQDLERGQTPLHIVSGLPYKSCKPRPRDIFCYMGKRENVECINGVNALLSEQVKKCSALNPKSNNGLSHLHIACMYNHTQAVELFLNAGESVDHATNSDYCGWPGYTALHFAVRYSAFEAAEILLKHGANIHMKNVEDESSLHLLVERLMDVAVFLIAETQERLCIYYKKERDTLESIASIFIENIMSENTTILDDTGLTALHLASTLRDSSTAEKLLTQNLNLNATTNSNSKLCPGWTPLHFAACFSVDTFKLLLSNGSDFNIKNAKDETPLDLCMQRYSPVIMHSILSVREELCNIMFTDGSTKLVDVLLIMADDGILKTFLQYAEDLNISIQLDSPVWPGYNLLHLLVLSEPVKYKSEILDQLVSEAVSRGTVYNEPPIWLHWRKIIKLLLKTNCTYNRENADGVTPIFLALKLHRVTSVDMILVPCEENCTNPSGLFLFHVACATGDLKSVQWFVEDDQAADVELPTKCSFEWYAKDNKTKLVSVRANSTPLHIAVMFNNKEVIEYLLSKNVDVDAKDSLGLTPIHLSMIHDYTGSTNISNLLLTRSWYFMDSVTEDGLSHLHVDACSNNETVIKELLQKGAEVNLRFQPKNAEVKAMFSEFAGKTPLHIAASKRNTLAVKALIKGGADIFAISGENSKKLLHEVMGLRIWYDVLEPFIMKLKHDYFDTIGPFDETGVTMLHFACLKGDVEWSKHLLEKGEDPNARVITEDDCLKYWRGSTPLDVLVYNLSCKNENPAEFTALIKLLIQFGADVTLKNGRGYTPLHMVYYEMTSEHETSLKDIVPSVTDILMNSLKSYNVNPVDPCNLSHLHVACKRGNLEVVKKFLDARADVNQSTIPREVNIYPFIRVSREVGYTPLHIACEEKNLELARLLIKGGANVSSEDVHGDTPLHLVLELKDFDSKLIKLLLRFGADINAKNTLGRTPLQYLFMKEFFTIEQFHFMLDYGAAIDFMDIRHGNVGILGIAMKNAVPDERGMIFDEIVKKYDLKNAIENGFNAIESVVAVEHNGQTTIDFHLRIFKMLIGMGCDVNQRDAKGNTAFHAAVRFYNVEAVEALLLYGASFNVLNKNGESPLTKEVLNVNINEFRRGIILNRLDEEICKMQFIGLDVIEYNLLAFTNVIGRYGHVVRATWISELNKINKTYIEKMPLAYFLSDSCVKPYSRVKLLQRQAIDIFFGQHDMLRQEFPIWYTCLLVQYRKAVTRVKMMKPAMDIIFSAGVELPALCLAMILEYLDYDELMTILYDKTT